MDIYCQNCGEECLIDEFHRIELAREARGEWYRGNICGHFFCGTCYTFKLEKTHHYYQKPILEPNVRYVILVSHSHEFIIIYFVKKYCFPRAHRCAMCRKIVEMIPVDYEMIEEYIGKLELRVLKFLLKLRNELYRPDCTEEQVTTAIC